MRLPPYSYVPGGPWPHPKSHPEGHSYHTPECAITPLDPQRWADSDAYLEGIRLFEAGYYWEAHEVWEGLWHAAGRSGPVATMLKALIKLAAAGVKIRERNLTGAATHAARAQVLFDQLRRETGPIFLGQDLERLADLADRTKSEPALLSESSRDLHAFVIFDHSLEGGQTQD